MDVAHGVAHAWIAAALRAALTDAPEPMGRFDEDAPLVHVMADRFLELDLFAGLPRPDGRQRVPVVGRGDRHNIDALVFKHLADVLLVFGGLASLALDGFHGAADGGLIAVA